MINQSDRLRAELADVLGQDFVSDSREHLDIYSRDAWPRIFLALRKGESIPSPDLVVRPGDIRQVAEIIRIARAFRVPLIPYGAGSGVCGGTYPLYGGITVDLKRIDHVGIVDPRDRLVEVGAGAIGEHLERRLGEQGYTLGHFPSSIYCSTLGGWIAARSAGQASSRYGKIEDMISGLGFVDGAGKIRRLQAGPRAGRGSDIMQTFIGSEGILGIVTDASLRVHRSPDFRFMRGVLMPSMEAGVEAIRRIFQSAYRPAVVRLYDPLDTLINKGGGTGDGFGALFYSALKKILSGKGGGTRKSPDKGKKGTRSIKNAAIRKVLSRPERFMEILDRFSGSCMLILGSEGNDERDVRGEASGILNICLEEGGRDLGAEPGEHWLEHRYSVSYKLVPALDSGLIVDTLETASTWSRLLPLYHEVRNAISPNAFVMAHLSHAYEDGCSIYFTFAAHGEGGAHNEDIYDLLWRRALEAVHSSGGTISHHHGIGMSKQAFMKKEHGEAGLSLLRALKQSLDPDGIMNPGKLGIGEGPNLPGELWRISGGPIFGSDAPEKKRFENQGAGPKIKPHEPGKGASGTEPEKSDTEANEIPRTDTDMECHETDLKKSIAEADEHKSDTELIEDQDNRNQKPQKKSIVLKPSDAEEIQSILKNCRESADSAFIQVDKLEPVPLKPMSSEMEQEAAGNGKTIIIQTEKLDEFRPDYENHLLRVGAGLHVSEIEIKLNKAGFTLGFHETPSITIGSMLARSEPGPSSRLSYPGWSPVAALDAALFQGETISTLTVPRAAAGPDFKALLVGGGCRFGIIIRATLRVFPLYETHEIIMAFADIKNAVDMIVEAMGRGLIPDSCSMLNNDDSSETEIKWGMRGDLAFLKRRRLSIDEICAGCGGRRVSSSTVAISYPKMEKKKISEYQTVFCIRWSGLLSLWKALRKNLPSCIIEINRVFHEGAIGTVFFSKDQEEIAGNLIIDCGGYPVTEKPEESSWLHETANALLGGKTKFHSHVGES